MKCPWERIDGFRSILEFSRFVQWMNEQIKTSVAIEVPVDSPYANAPSLREKWFLHVDSGEKWRLVWPDPPFPGIFEVVLSIHRGV